MDEIRKQNSHWNVKYSIGNIVTNILITRNVTGWLKDLLDDHLLSYVMSCQWSVQNKSNILKPKQWNNWFIGRYDAH